MWSKLGAVFGIHIAAVMAGAAPRRLLCRAGEGRTSHLSLTPVPLTCLCAHIRVTLLSAGAGSAAAAALVLRCAGP